MFLCGTPPIQGVISTLNCDKPAQQALKAKCNETKYSTQIGPQRRKQLGGENALVVIDSFPVGYKKFCQDVSIKDEDRLILGFADIAVIPPKYHFEFLTSSTSTDEDILRVIRSVVLPGSVLVVDDSFTNVFARLGLVYKTVVTVDMLRRHNSAQQNIVDNLKQVWDHVITVCDSANDISEVEHLLQSISN